MYDDFYNVIGFIEYFRLIYCFAKKLKMTDHLFTSTLEMDFL